MANAEVFNGVGTGGDVVCDLVGEEAPLAHGEHGLADGGGLLGVGVVANLIGGEHGITVAQEGSAAEDGVVGLQVVVLLRRGEFDLFVRGQL